MMRLAWVCVLPLLMGCASSAEQWLAAEREQIQAGSLSVARGGVLVVETRYTNPATTIETYRTGKRPSEGVLDGAKDVALGIVNALATIAEPWCAAIPIVGYVSGAIVQKVGDCQYVSQTVMIPMAEVGSVAIAFETDGGRKDVRSILVTGRDAGE